jgi:hypothetical protein
MEIDLKLLEVIKNLNV